MNDQKETKAKETIIRYMKKRNIPSSQTLGEYFHIEHGSWEAQPVESLRLSDYATKLLKRQLKADTIKKVLALSTDTLASTKGLGKKSFRSIYLAIDMIRRAARKSVPSDSLEVNKNFVLRAELEPYRFLMGRGDWSWIESANLSPAGSQQAEHIKECFYLVKGDLLDRALLNYEKTSTLLENLCQDFHIMHETRTKIDQLLSNIPPERLELPAKGFLFAIHRMPQTRKLVMDCFADQECSLGSIKSYRNIYDFLQRQQLFSFLERCSVDPSAEKESFLAKFNKFSELQQNILFQRSKGRKFRELAESNGLSPQRIQQLEKPCIEAFVSWDEKHNLLLLISALLGSAATISYDMLIPFLEDDTDLFFYLFSKRDCKYYHFSSEQNVFVIDFSY